MLLFYVYYNFNSAYYMYKRDEEMYKKKNLLKSWSCTCFAQGKARKKLVVLFRYHACSTTVIATLTTLIWVGVASVFVFVFGSTLVYIKMKRTWTEIDRKCHSTNNKLAMLLLFFFFIYYICVCCIFIFSIFNVWTVYIRAYCKLDLIFYCRILIVFFFFILL